MERAKLIRYTKHPIHRYMDEYVYECIDCGEEFTRATNAKNINPYCGKCYRKRESEKQRERNKRKRNKDIICELDNLKNKMNTYCDLHGIYDWGLIDLIDERISELKGEHHGDDIQK